MKKVFKNTNTKMCNIYRFIIRCCFPPVPDRPEALDLSVPRPTLRAQPDFLHMHVFLWCPELWKKFVIMHSGKGLGYCQAHFTSIKVIMNRISITNLTVFLLWVIIHVDVSRRRPPSNFLQRPRFTAAQKRAEWINNRTLPLISSL